MQSDTSGNQKSLGAVIKGLTEDLSTLFRSEIALAKLEIRESVSGLGGIGALLAVALFFALFGLAFLLVTAILALALVIPAWLATLIVAVILLTLAAILAVTAKNKISKIKLVPSGAIGNIKQDIQSIKADLSRLKENNSDV